MARRRRHGGRRARPLLGPLLLLLVLAAGAALGWRWYEQRRAGSAQRPARDDTAVVDRDPARIDPAFDGRRVRLRGDLQIGAVPRDAQLGVSAQAAVLFRDVRMLQWQERCAGSDCTYAMDWSAQPIDSSRFRHPEGHANPALPFTAARFDAAGLRLGAYAVDAELVATQASAVAHKVGAADLPPNLAAVFRIVDGALVAGGEADTAKVGTIRITYRTIPPGSIELTGVQRGERLSAR